MKTNVQREWLGTALGVAAALLLANAASAQSECGPSPPPGTQCCELPTSGPVVYVSTYDDGLVCVTNGATDNDHIIGSSPAWELYLYAWNGSSSSTGTKCDPTNDAGGEICGLDVEIHVDLPAYIVDFTPTTGDPTLAVLKYSPTDFSSNTEQSIRIAVPRSVPAPTDASPVRLGTLVLDTTGYIITDPPNPPDPPIFIEFSVNVVEGQIVDTQRQLITLPGAVIAKAVPEPGLWLQLGTALVGLAGLHRLRERRARRAR